MGAKPKPAKTKLKPCPKCGGEAITMMYKRKAIVQCLECIEFVYRSTTEVAIDAWNRRAPLDPTPPARED